MFNLQKYTFYFKYQIITLFFIKIPLPMLSMHEEG